MQQIYSRLKEKVKDELTFKILIWYDYKPQCQKSYYILNLQTNKGWSKRYKENVKKSLEKGFKKIIILLNKTQLIKNYIYNINFLNNKIIKCYLLKITTTLNYFLHSRFSNLNNMYLSICILITFNTLPILFNQIIEFLTIVLKNYL